MRQKLDIYGDRKQNYQRELVALSKCPTTARNKELITQWQNHLFATGCGEIRVAKVTSQMRKVVLHFGKDLDTVTRTDVERVIAEYTRAANWSAATKADYRRCVKQFFRWYSEHDPRLEDGDKEAILLYKYLERHVTTAYKENQYDYSEVINEDDLRLIIERGCSSVREKALLSVLHEGGFRAGEMLNMQIRDLEFKEDRVVVVVDGKTGRRRVPLVTSMGLLARWLEEHPFPENTHSYLWLGANRAHMHQPLKRIGAQKLVDRCFDKAACKKRHNLHWFRHSRATLLARHMTEVMMCGFFGWSIGSKQVRRYVHSNVAQLEDAVLQMNGLKKKEQERDLPQKCPCCQMINDSGARYCRRCGRAQSISTLVEDDRKRNNATNEAISLMEKIMANPILKEQFSKLTASPISNL